MSAELFTPSTQEPVADHLLILTPNLDTRIHLARELAACGLAAENAGPTLRLPIGDLDLKSILEGLGASLDLKQRNDVRIAIIPRNTDDRTRRKAIALARPMTTILQDYCDSWLAAMLERGSFMVAFQPIVQYPPGRVHGYECLIRGIGEGKRIIPPARLFQAAKNLGMEHLLDRAACKCSLNTASEMGFSNIQYFINLSAQGIENAHACAQSMAAQVEIGSLRTDQFVFEITQAEAVKDRAHLRAVVEAFREAGFGVSLDDVGTGNASLLSLDQIVPDYIKLDADLCRGAANGGTRAALVKELTAAASQHGIVTIAKGIETEDQLRWLIDADIKLSQGFIHAQPQPMPLDADAEDQMLRQVRRTAILALD